MDATDVALEQTILTLLDASTRGATVSPDDVVRALGASDASGNVKAALVGDGHATDGLAADGLAADGPALEQRARAAARRLAATGEVDIVLGSSLVDPSTARGAIRTRSARS